MATKKEFILYFTDSNGFGDTRKMDLGSRAYKKFNYILKVLHFSNLETQLRYPEQSTSKFILKLEAIILGTKLTEKISTLIKKQFAFSSISSLYHLP